MLMGRDFEKNLPVISFYASDIQLYGHRGPAEPLFPSTGHLSGIWDGIN